MNVKKRTFEMIFKHPVIFSLIQCLLVFLAFFALNRFRFSYAECDDFFIAELLSQQDPAIPFVSFFITYPIACLQKICGDVNVYIIILELFSFSSLVTINYLIVVDNMGLNRLVLCTVLDLVLIEPTVVMVQFTHVATITSTAGLMALLFSMFAVCKRKRRIVLGVWGLILMIFGASLRISPFKLICVFALISVIAIGFYQFVSKKTTVKNAIDVILKHNLKKVVAVIAAICFVFLLNNLSDQLKNSIEGYSELKEFNVAYARLNDYQCAPYEGNEEFYSEIGVSENDLAMIRSSYTDPDFFTVDMIEKMADYSQTNANGGLGNRASVQQMIQSIIFGIQNRLGISENLVFALIICYVLICFVLLIVFRKKRLIDLIVLVLFWILFFSIFLLLRSKFIYLFIPVCLFSIYLTVFCSKQYRVLSIIISLASMAFYLYLFCSRINFRSVLCIMVPVICIFAMSIVYSKSEIPSFHRLYPKIINTTLGLICIFCGILFSGIVYRIDAYPILTFDKSGINEIVDYVSNNQDKTYFISYYHTNLLRKNYDNPFMLPKEHDNLVGYTGWITKSITNQDHLKKNHAEHFFKDAVNSHIRFIFYKDDISYVEKFNEYFNEHYKNDSREITMKLENELTDCLIYQVVTE